VTWTFSVSVSGGSNVGRQLRLHAADCPAVSVLLILKTGEAERSWVRRFCSVALQGYFEARVLVSSDICRDASYVNCCCSIEMHGSCMWLLAGQMQAIRVEG
jgi:hypothetical protein